MRTRLALGSRSLSLSQTVALALCIGFGLAFVIANLRSWQMEDADAYWNAALRLRDGAALYPPLDDVSAPDVYRYAPWFAWLWVPLTHLPKGAVMAWWGAILVVASFVALLPLARVRSLATACLAALLGGLLIRTASTGNVHALLIAVLVMGARSRGGPVWIGVAASLKLVPIAYALVYVGRREWRRAAAALVVTAALSAPALLYDLRAYPGDPGASFSLLTVGGPLPWVTVVLVLAGVAVMAGRGPYGWLAAATAVIAAIPRLELYNLTYLLVGVWPRGGQARGGGIELPQPMGVAADGADPDTAPRG